MTESFEDTLKKMSNFWERVQKTQTCWLWIGPLYRKGYGQINGKSAHRVSWEMHNGPIPEGSLVCHHCDVRNCVRPDHLFLGTHADNLRDAYSKGRRQQMFLARERNPNAKLSEDSVNYIRSSPKSLRQLAKELGVAHSEIHKIRRNVRWNVLTETR